MPTLKARLEKLERAVTEQRRRQQDGQDHGSEPLRRLLGFLDIQELGLLARLVQAASSRGAVAFTDLLPPEQKILEVLFSRAERRRAEAAEQTPGAAT